MFVLLFTGQSATGKSTIAKLLTEFDPRWKIVNERSLLHELCLDAGESRVRNWWQKAGTRHLVQHTREKTLISLRHMRENGVNVVIDGCYDPLLGRAIGESFPDAVRVTVFIYASLDRRQSNMQRRLNCSLDEAVVEMRLIDQFKTEAGMNEVIAQADAEIVNHKSASESLAVLVRFLRSRGCEVGQ